MNDEILIASQSYSMDELLRRDGALHIGFGERIAGGAEGVFGGKFGDEVEAEVLEDGDVAGLGDGVEGEGSAMVLAGDGEEGANESSGDAAAAGVGVDG
jgi:hypothetical protein